jgi:hypothetical protein
MRKRVALFKVRKLEKIRAEERKRIAYLRSLQKKRSEKKFSNEEEMDEIAEESVSRPSSPKKKEDLKRPTSPAKENQTEVADNKRPISAAVRTVTSEPAANNAALQEIDMKMKMLEELEKRIKLSEENLLNEAKKAEEKVQHQIKLLEEKTKQAENERLAREELMRLAVGPLSYRSPFSTGRSQFATNPGGPIRSPYSSLPGGVAGMPPHLMGSGGASHPSIHYGQAEKLEFDGHEWMQLWDEQTHAFYWWCEALQMSQWHRPGTDEENDNKFETQTDSGNESVGGMTDYSDHESTLYPESEYGEASSLWQEFWDEQAQAKYWYNNSTVSVICISLSLRNY